MEKPHEVVIEVTAACNFNCSKCYNLASFAADGRKIAAEPDFIKSVIDSIAKAGIPRVRFSGGEPLARRDIFDLMAYAQDRGLKIWLNSNATYVNETNIALLERYVENVLVSFNGHDAASDEEWTNTRNSFERKIAGMKLLRASRVQMLRAGTVLTPNNVRNLEKIFEVVQDIGVHYWEVYRTIAVEKTLVKPDLPLILQKLAFLSHRFGKVIPLVNAIPYCASDPETMSRFCIGTFSDDGHSRFIVDPRGFAKPSYYINVDLGDPRDVMSCWNHPFMRKMRNLELVPEACRSCQYLQKCKGGSRYGAYLFTGDYTKPDPLMEIK